MRISSHVVLLRPATHDAIEGLREPCFKGALTKQRPSKTTHATVPPSICTRSIHSMTTSPFIAKSSSALQVGRSDVVGNFQMRASTLRAVHTSEAADTKRNSIFNRFHITSFLAAHPSQKLCIPIHLLANPFLFRFLHSKRKSIPSPSFPAIAKDSDLVPL